MTDAREIAERLAEEFQRSRSAYIYPDQLAVRVERALTAYGTAQHKAGQEDMRDQAATRIKLMRDAHDKDSPEGRILMSAIVAIAVLPVEKEDG